MWPFKWKLLSSNFLWCCWLLTILSSKSWHVVVPVLNLVHLHEGPKLNRRDSHPLFQNNIPGMANSEIHFLFSSVDLRAPMLHYQNPRKTPKKHEKYFNTRQLEAWTLVTRLLLSKVYSSYFTYHFKVSFKFKSGCYYPQQGHAMITLIFLFSPRPPITIPFWGNIVAFKPPCQKKMATST